MLEGDKTAIIYNGDRIPYSQINHEANMIAAYIQSYITDITDKSVIAIALPRTPFLISAMLASIQLKIPFVPIDPQVPSERVKQITAAAEISLFITSKEISQKYNNIPNKVFIEDISCITNKAPLNPGSKNDIMYILFTSGSTGMSKGVKVTYKGFQNFIEGISEIIEFTTGKRIACLTTVSFDIFFLESLMALYQGLTVVLANEEEQRNPKLMAKLIQDNNVEMVQMTPSRMQLLLNHDKELKCMSHIKEIMIGGESFPLSILQALQEKTTAKIYNMYGPTETTIWSTVSELTYKDHIDIGHPIKNTAVYIVDENLTILPDGQAGEICIAGEGLAKGYVGSHNMTTKKFVLLPQKPDIRVFRTGDIGRRLSDATLEYLGRTDNQVKIRGHRIELEEIETHLNQFKGVKQSIVFPIERSETNKILGTFYTSDINISEKDMIRYLSEQLPEYMIPAVFKRVESFPQTFNGKVDRAKVLDCVEIKEKTETDLVGDNLTDSQKKILGVLQASIDEKIVNGISLDADFSSVGMDSISFIKIVVALECEFNFEFDDERLLIDAFPTIKSMIEYVDAKIKTHNCDNT